MIMLSDSHNVDINDQPNWWRPLTALPLLINLMIMSVSLRLWYYSDMPFRASALGVSISLIPIALAEAFPETANMPLILIGFMQHFVFIWDDCLDGLIISHRRFYVKVYLHAFAAFTATFFIDDVPSTCEFLQTSTTQLLWPFPVKSHLTIIIFIVLTLSVLVATIIITPPQNNRTAHIQFLAASIICFVLLLLLLASIMQWCETGNSGFFLSFVYLETIPVATFFGFSDRSEPVEEREGVPV